MHTRTELINLLFETYKFKSYLEIGISNPIDNFNLINAIDKQSVDPNPNGECDYIMTSDLFFSDYIKDKKYDVIFVDGLHTEEQAYIDVINAITHLNDGGFIVMHDCNPPTEYHARSYESFLKTKGAWNGTVFRAFIKLKQELNDWSCFVVDEDWGCGVLTKRNVIKNNSLNAEINIITWDNFDVNRKELLELIDFEKYKENIKNAND